MEKAINWFTHNHVAANFIMIVILVMGFTTWGQLKKEIFPETSIDTILVQVPYPNATPAEVEKGIIVPIEEAIQDLDGIKRIRSTAALGMGAIQVEVASGYDIRELMDDVKTRVDAVQNIAEDAEEPTLEELMIKSQVMSIAVSADTDEKTLRGIAENVRDGLLAFDGGKGGSRVTQAILAGVREYEISIEVSEDTLRQYGLTFDQVAMAVRKSSLDLPGGSVRTGSGEVLIRTEARKYSAEEFVPITVVTRQDGSVVRLGDIAEIRDGFEETDLEARFWSGLHEDQLGDTEGRRAILVNVYRVGNEDTLEIARAVKNYIYDVGPGVIPDGVTLEIWKDDSAYLEGRLKLLAKNGLFGLVLVAIVLALFLRPSLALLVALGIPVSFAGAVAMMPINGVSINMISLFAFILVLGIVVDDAIVVGENVYRRMRNGEDPKTAAPRGTHEVGVVVIFGILTTMIAFTPMLGLTGVSGKIWPNIPLIVIPTLAFSLFQSKLILPSHLALLKPYNPNQKLGPILKAQHWFSRGLEKFVDRFYRPSLRIALHNRYIVMCGFVAIFISVMSLVVSGWVKFQFFPEVEADVAVAKLTMPKGVPFEATQEAIAQIERAALRLNDTYQDDAGNPIIRNMLISVGTQPFQVGFGAVGGIPMASNLGEVTLELQPSANRKYLGQEIVSSWREEVGEIPGAVEATFRTEAAGGGNAIDLDISGPNLDDLENATIEIKKALAEYGAIDIGDSNLEGKRELKLKILPGAEALGLRLEDVARQVRQGFYGDEIQRLQRGRNEVKVFVRYPREERKSIADLLERIKIRTNTGAEVPFSEVATAEYGRAYSSIARADRQRTIKISADVDKGKGVNANELVKALTEGMPPRTAIKRAIAYFKQWGRNIVNFFRSIFGREPLPEKEDGPLVKILSKFPLVNYSFEGEQKDQRESIGQMGKKFVLALLMMYVLMAIPLKSYIQPMIVMSVIPFGIVGAVVGHLLMGWLVAPGLAVLSIMSMCGIVALSGVVVNDSLVLVDYVNRHRDEGHGLVDAVWEAGAARFRPILLTSLTTFAGLTPMLLETDIQARFLIPMAVSLSFGILFATFITLILVPCVYLMLEDVKKRFRNETASA